LEGLREKLAKANGTIPTFDMTTGFVINYSPDDAVRFDLEGKPLEVLDRAYRLGQATFHLKGRAVSREEWKGTRGEVEIVETK
jgi:hypothetical protein